MSGDNTAASSYAPKSPDLSSFYSARPTEPAPQTQPPSHSTHHYHNPQSEHKLHSAPSAHTHAHASIHHPFPPHSRTLSHPHPLSTPHSHPSYYQPVPALDLGLPTKPEHEYSAHVPALHDPYQVAVPADPGHLPPTANPYHDVPSQHQQQPYGLLYPNQHQHQHHYAGAASYGLPFAANSHHPQPPNTGASANANVHASLPSSNMPPRKAAAPPPPAPIIEPSPVRTKFPTARIKRIMQADEEVGKVAQQTPIAVGKALELFMIQLVSKSADVAKEKGSKRVTASMLKQVVETDDQWDFLRDIVSRVEHEKEGKAKAKAESESEEEEPEPKKRGRGGGRRKKS